MGTHDGHRGRMRERFQKSGGASFEKHELVEMLLYYAYPRRDTNETAHNMLDAFGKSLTQLVNSDPETISKTCGISESAATLFSLIGEVSRRMDIEKWDEKVCLRSTGYAGEYAKSYLSNLNTEKMYVVCLDNSLSVINCVEAGNGAVGSVSLEMRDLIEIAIRNKAAKIMLMHNHPSGIARPSPGDLTFTVKCTEALKVIGVDLEDHIIVGGGEYFSMKAENLIKKGDV
ncbi:MAG: DNA repair protein RadC [Clostridiales bacterium]|nr:DNA repair protein RadC [Clostridiales bacterium]